MKLSELRVSHLLASFSVAALVISGCASSDDDEAQRLAGQLVSSLHSEDLAPRLTVDVAAALYGTNAATVCEAFDGPLSSAERIILLGNPSGRRPKTITTDSVSYVRLVVETYCPERSEYLADVVDELDPFESQ